jgi:hypothetical protein
MGDSENVSMNMIYREILNLRKDISIIEHALIPTEKLSAKELEEYKKDLEEARKDRIKIR